MARFSLALALAILITISYLASTSEAQSVAAGLFALNGRTTAGANSSQVDWYNACCHGLIDG